MANPGREPAAGPARAASSKQGLTEQSDTRSPSLEKDPLADIPEGSSIWTAPQSHLHPTAPEAHEFPVSRPMPKGLTVQQTLAEMRARDAAAMQKLSKAEMPARWQRGAQLAGAALAVGLTGYAVVFHDFGEKEHVFSPVSEI